MTLVILTFALKPKATRRKFYVCLFGSTIKPLGVPLFQTHFRKIQPYMFSIFVLIIYFPQVQISYP